ncbi:hypothetical protein KI387_005880, partial [Taxus chinensis]
MNMSAKGAGFQEDYEDGLVKRYAYEERTSWNVYDVEGSPRYDLSCFISSQILSFDRYDFEHDREMDMRCNMEYIGCIFIGTLALNIWVHMEHDGKGERVIITLPNDGNHNNKLVGPYEKFIIRRHK